MIQNTKSFSKQFLLISGFSCLMMSVACSPTINKRGNLLESYQIDEIKVGETTRSEVLRNLGSPTAKGTFDTNIWYYIGQKTEKTGIFDPEIVEEKVYVAQFNDAGILEHFEPVEGGRVKIPYSRQKTITGGTETTIMQDLLGNLGKFNPQTGEGQ